MSNPNPKVQSLSMQRLLSDPATSRWFKSALLWALERDPVDALNDALLLADLLDARLRMVLKLDEGA